MQRKFLHGNFTSEAHFKDNAPLACVRNAIWPNEFRVALMKKMYSSGSMFLQAAVGPTHHATYSFLSIQDSLALSRTAHYCATYDFLLNIFLESQASFRSERAFLCAKTASSRHYFFQRKRG